MVNDNKILTVSYGTFSCTLEGFDDPFSTMTDIAEYFRDLAAADRFFGAEPPTPDAAMLHKIAEQTERRPMDAEVGDNSLTLRPTRAQQPVTADAADGPYFGPTVTAAIADDVVLSHDDTPELDAAAKEPAPAPVEEAAEEEFEPEVAEIEEEFDDVADEDDAEAEAEAVLTAPEEEAEDDFEASSVAAKLARIRQLVADEDAADAYSEDQHAEDFSAAPAEAPAEEAVEEIVAEEPAPAPKQAIVRKVRKADAPAAPLVLEEVAEDDEDEEHAALPETDLDADDEADLQAELAAIAAEDDDAQETTESQPAAVRATLPERDDAALERLFAATDSHMSGEETSRRIAHISHLKAAVAARKADQDSADVAEPSDDTETYRADLASAVKPRRPSARGERTERPDTRPAPLVLVSEQRVDAAPAEDSADDGSVRPRRVRRAAAQEDQVLAAVSQAAPKPAPAAPVAEDDNIFTGTSDFEEFAAEMGATDLVDVLEAAAAFSAVVEGEDTFSRPKLLHLAAEASGEFSREDGLRGFGQLLRNGTIRKVKRGAFALGDDSRYADHAASRSATG